MIKRLNELLQVFLGNILLPLFYCIAQDIFKLVAVHILELFGVVHGRLVEHVVRERIAALVQQLGKHVDIARLHGVHQRCRAAVGTPIDVDVGSVLQQEPNHFQIAFTTSAMECSAAHNISLVHALLRLQD